MSIEHIYGVQGHKKSFSSWLSSASLGLTELSHSCSNVHRLESCRYHLKTHIGEKLVYLLGPD